MRMIALPVLIAAAAPARADIWVRTGKDGIPHYTNIPEGPGWTKILHTGEGKARARRGDCPRCDRVPARDRSPERFSRHDRHVQDAAAVYRIPVALVRAVIGVESDFDPRVVSSAGARGLMQLMPDTAEAMGVRQVFDPRENIFGGTRLLRVLANRFDGDLVLTLAGYHAGAAAVQRHGGIPPYPRTQQYLRMVLARYHRYRERFP